MKFTPVLICAAVFGLAFTLATSSPAQTTQQGVATIVRVQGEASYALGDGVWHPLVPGKILTAGSTIRTEDNAMVDIVLGKGIQMPQAAPVPNDVSFAPDAQVRGMVDYKPSAEQNVVRLLGNTVLSIDKLTVSDTGVDTVSDTELNLQKGKIFASVKKLSAASTYFIKIPNGMAGVRGTLFGLDANGWLSVLKNSVYLSIVGPDGKLTTVQVDQGNQFNPNTGQISPLPPQIIALLQQIATALDSLYLEVVSFSFDHTTCHISPTSGFFNRGR
ncbi:MAG TPA: FecR domain-containing protein [Verrucomicrobiae bacterium]|nr:FecR domain-containing protein [Verrucomicrobiae bacterium]